MQQQKNIRLLGWMLAVYTLIKAALAGAKIGLGYWFGSVAVIGDGVHDLTDIGSSVMIALSLYLLAQPTNRRHPFGQARIEYVATGVIGAIILYAGLRVAMEAWDRIIHPQYLVIEPVLLGVLIGSVLVQLGLIAFFRRLAARTDSDLVTALTADAYSDMLLTISVLVSIAAQFLFTWQIDAYIGAMVALALLYTGWTILTRGVNKLLGKRIGEQEEREMLAYIRSLPEVEGVHDLIVHDYGSGLRFISFHVEVDSRMGLLGAHRIADYIEWAVQDKYRAQVTVHIDPRNVADPEAALVENEVRRMVAEINPSWNVHDFFADRRSYGWRVHFDVSVGDETRERDEEIFRWICDTIRLRHPEYRISLVVDRNYIRGNVWTQEEPDGENA
ncbi:MAG: cation diffusion facilitator family transporter [Veillonellaceae bacterium]|nr:cation diffusion facilitator family transporter [Veillonellaceae bacterium]